MKKYLIITLVFFSQTFIYSQEKQYKVGTIGFYNLENLFDTLDAPDIRDEEFTPTGKRLWSGKIYHEKLDHLAKVVSEIGKELSPDGIAVLGVSEIENRAVLEDFVEHPLLADRNYQIVHYDSPDERGVDVGLIYNPKYFKVTDSRSIPVILYHGNGERDFTRDVLLVSGDFDGDQMHIMVNHWPSRSGGEKASKHTREAAAKVCKNIADSLSGAEPYAKILIMGDLNDDPVNSSVKNILQSRRQKSKVRKGDLYNPMWDIYRRGFGTLAYRDSWNLFDQVIISYGFLTKKTGGYKFFKANIFNKKYLVQKTGRYKGYPYRSFAGDKYIGGYSDHFPVYVYLLKEAK